MIRFLAGDMAPQEESDLAEHFRQCPTCHRLAEWLSNDPEARALLVSPPMRAARCALEASLVELQGRLQALALYDAVGELENEATSSTIAGGATQCIQPGPQRTAAPQ